MDYEAKQPSEADWHAFDFTAVFTDPGETIASKTEAATLIADGSVSTATVLNTVKSYIDGLVVYLWVRAGADGEQHKITCVATSSTGRIAEGDVLYTVTNQ